MAPTALQRDGGDLKTVARFDDPTEAQLLQGLLQSEGIPASLADAHLVQAYRLLSSALGGVRVQVPAHRFDEAMQVIAAFEAGDYALDEDSDPEALD